MKIVVYFLFEWNTIRYSLISVESSHLHIFSLSRNFPLFVQKWMCTLCSSVEQNAELN